MESVRTAIAVRIGVPRPSNITMNLSPAPIIFVVWAALIAVFDCRRRRIPNSLVVAGLAMALGCALVQSGPFGISAGQSAVGGLVGLAALLPFFALGVMGSADVKVFAVLGTWCGMRALPGLWIAASLAAGVHALWLVMSSGTPLAAIGRQAGPTFEVAGKRGAPYAAFMTLAALGWLAVQSFAGRVR